jgi:hypothetical protein
MRADTFLHQGDMDGVAVWRKIRAALLDLSNIRFRADTVELILALVFLAAGQTAHADVTGNLLRGFGCWGTV